MLISLAGLPGVGKTTIARELARQIGAVHLEIDSIEQAIRESGIATASGELDSYRMAYRVAYAVARDNLRLGRTVIVDCVNPIALTRNAWLEVAKAAGVKAIEVEVVCSDRNERLSRFGPSTDHAAGMPRWQVVEQNYQRWDREHVSVDTADQTVDAVVGALRRELERIWS